MCSNWGEKKKFTSALNISLLLFFKGIPIYGALQAYFMISAHPPSTVFTWVSIHENLFYLENMFPSLVSQAVSEMFKKSLSTLMDDFQPLANSVADMMIQMYETTPHASILDVARQVCSFLLLYLSLWNFSCIQCFMLSKKLRRCAHW